MKRVAAQQAPQPEVRTAQGPVFFDRFHRILGASGREPARRWEQRRDEQLIGSYDTDENELHLLPAFFKKVMKSASRS